YRFFNKRKETINNVQVQRTFEIGRKNNKIFLALNYLSFCISASIKCLFLKGKYDVVYSYQLSPVIMAIPAIIYSKIHKKKLILYCLDLWPESLCTVGIKNSSIIYKIFDKISRKIYNSCDRILITSEKFKEYLVNIHNVVEKKIKYLPQCSFDFKCDKKIAKKDTTNFIFAGNIGKSQNVELIVEAFSRLSPKYKAVVYIVGEGSNLNNIKNMVKNKNVQDRFIFVNQISKEKIKEYYNLADACFLTLTDNKSIGNTVPLKLQGYMSTGKPILASVNGSASKLINESKCGKCVNANDIVSFVKLIEDFIENKPKYIKYGNNGRKFYEENFTIEGNTKQIIREMKEIIGE
ncbi:MAG: glycosyltransferase family 4 protein, partial [Clostridia bacterium]